MAIKQVTCSICGMKLNKAQTYALPDWTRACRTHPEAQSAAEANRKAMTEHLKAQQQAIADAAVTVQETETPQEAIQA